MIDWTTENFNQETLIKGQKQQKEDREFNLLMLLWTSNLPRFIYG